MKRSLLVIGLLLWIGAEAWAIPPFARRYKTACQTCHVIIPKLNTFGEAFRLNGYRIPEEDEAFIKDEPLSQGADQWRDLFPQAIWPADIAGMPPIGLRIISDLEVTDAESDGRRMNFEFPYEFEILSGGRIGDQIGFFAEVEWKQQGVAEIKQTYMVVNDFLGWLGVPEKLVNLRVGLMDLQHLLSYSNVTRAGKSHPLWGNLKLSDYTMGTAAANIRSDVGFRLQDNQPAIELYSIAFKRLLLAVGWATGNGEARFDNDTHKDIYYKVKLKLFGRDFHGRVEEETTSTDTKSSGGWVDNSILLEHFGYFGAAPAADAANNAVTAGNKHPQSSFNFLGGAIRGLYENLDLSVGAVWGHYDDPWGTSSREDTDTFTWFAKAEYQFLPWLMGRVVYESFVMDEPDDVAKLFRPAATLEKAGWTYNAALDRSRILYGPVIALRSNIAIRVEHELYLEHDGADRARMDKPSAFWLRLDFAW